MALVVFLRAVNVGGHNTFRPSVLANELREYDVVNIGAAGTFVVRRAVSQEKFRRELLNRLAFPTHIMICEAAPSPASRRRIRLRVSLQVRRLSASSTYYRNLFASCLR